jgi:hypothetical protein
MFANLRLFVIFVTQYLLSFLRVKPAHRLAGVRCAETHSQRYSETTGFRVSPCASVIEEYANVGFDMAHISWGIFYGRMED